MPLNYALYENNLTSDPDDYLAVPQTEVTRTQDDLVDLMISRGSTVTKAEALSVLEEYALAIEQVLKTGGSITTPLFKLSISITGVFNGLGDNFDPKRHQARIRIAAGIRLKETESKVEIRKVTADRPMPLVQEFKDVASNLVNEKLTPGSVGQLTGSRLKFDEADALQGIFLVASNGKETKVPKMIRHKPAELIFMLPPALPAGDYRLEVRTVFQNTKELRIGTLPGPLTIA